MVTVNIGIYLNTSLWLIKLVNSNKMGGWHTSPSKHRQRHGHN